MSAMNFRPARSSGILAALDVGTFKTVCLIATPNRDGRASRIVGVGLAPSDGMQSGMIVDLAAAEAAIRTAIAEAETVAGVRLEHIDVSINTASLASRAFAASIAVPDGIVSRHALSNLEESVRRKAGAPGRQLLQLEARGYSADAGCWVPDPVGLPAERLAAQIFSVSADRPAISNLSRTIERCYLNCRRLVPGPIASAIGVTRDEERRQGCLVIDVGAGVTGLTAFLEGRPVFASTLPLGSAQITRDIGHALRTPLQEAERIKTLYGTVLIAQSDQHDVFTYAAIGDGEAHEQRSTKADLARIIQARMAHLLHLVREQFASAGLLDGNTARIILCGGGSELTGLQSFAESVFRRPVRAGRPEQISGLPPLYASAGFAAVVGVLRAVAESAAIDLPATGSAEAQLGYIGRVGQWLKDGF